MIGLTSDTVKNESVQVVLCRLADAKYAIEIEHVQEIVRRTQVTRVPRTRPWIAGVINLRGTVTPTLNLHKRFALPEEEVTEDSRIVIVKYNNQSYGIMVDDASEVVRVPSHSIETNPSLEQEDRDYIKGLARYDRELYILLNPGEMLKFFR